MSTAINGGSLGDAFRSSVVGDMAAVGANAVGQGSNALSAGNILGHAAVACAAAAANGKDCASGAIGGAGAAIANPLLDRAIGGSDGSGWGSNPETAQQWQSATLQLGSMAVSAATAAAFGKEGMTAALAAQNETVNNFLTKENILAKQARLAAATTPEQRAAIIKEYLGVSRDNTNKALADVKSVMTVAELEATRDNLATLVSGPTACNASLSCRTDVRNGISEINGILNSARAGEKMEPVVLAAEAVLTLVTAGEYLVARNGLRAGVAGAEALVGDIVTNGAANRAVHEVYKDGLIAAMERPAVSDPVLSRLVDQLYRPNATVGSGSTAAAVRQELATGEPVGGAFHSLKAEENIAALQKWLDRSPTARPGDRAAAENIIRDLKNALRGE